MGQYGISAALSALWRGRAFVLPRRFQRCHGCPSSRSRFPRQSHLGTLQAAIIFFGIRYHGGGGVGSAFGNAVLRSNGAAVGADLCLARS